MYVIASKTSSPSQSNNLNLPKLLHNLISVFGSAAENHGLRSRNMLDQITWTFRFAQRNQSQSLEDGIQTYISQIYFLLCMYDNFK